MVGKSGKHSFSVEMKDKHYVNRMSFQEEVDDHVLFEGFLGELKGVSMIEEVMLEIEGTNGILKLDITRQELDLHLSKNPTLQGGEAR
jgi:hypothetical protein